MTNMNQLKQKLFWVEDSVADRELIKIAFKKALYDPSEHLHFFQTGEEILSYLEDSGETPRLLVLDINLPGINGLEILRTLRSSPHYKMIPVVMFTGSTLTSDITKAYDYFANGYLEKPGNFVDLIEITKNLCDFWLRKNISLPSYTLSSVA